MLVTFYKDSNISQVGSSNVVLFLLAALFSRFIYFGCRDVLSCVVTERTPYLAARLCR
jgi:hypothetical protein